MPNISDILAAALPEFGKAVFSQPTDKAAAQKLSVRPLVIRGETVYQAESIRDNKAMHQNLSADELTALCRSELEGRYRQVLIVSGGESRRSVSSAATAATSSPARPPRPPLPPPRTTAKRNIFLRRASTSRARRSRRVHRRLQNPPRQVRQIQADKPLHRAYRRRGRFLRPR